MSGKRRASAPAAHVSSEALPPAEPVLGEEDDQSGSPKPPKSARLSSKAAKPSNAKPKSAKAATQPATKPAEVSAPQTHVSQYFSEEEEGGDGVRADTLHDAIIKSIPGCLAACFPVVKEAITERNASFTDVVKAALRAAAAARAAVKEVYAKP